VRERVYIKNETLFVRRCWVGLESCLGIGETKRAKERLSE